MGVRLQRWSGILLLSTLLFAGGSSASAQSTSLEDKPLNQPTIPEAFNRNANFDKFFFDTSILGDMAWLVGFPHTWSGFKQGPSWFDEARLRKLVGRRTEALYFDVLRQQAETEPYQRTSDLPSPYSTSILELEKNPTTPPTNTLEFDFLVPEGN